MSNQPEHETTLFTEREKRAIRLTLIALAEKLIPNGSPQQWALLIDQTLMENGGLNDAEAVDLVVKLSNQEQKQAAERDELLQAVRYFATQARRGQ